MSRLLGKDQEFKILIVGLHNAGKTTILYKLSLGEVVVTSPTIGSNVEQVDHNNVKFQVWDLGGQENLRSSWDTYYAGTSAVIYVIDAADETNALVSQMEFQNVVNHADLEESSILVLANKADLPNAKSDAEITEAFQLHDLKKHDWRLQRCCALTGDGLEEGLDWLTAKLDTKAGKRKEEAKE